MESKETLDVFNIKERKGKDSFFRNIGVAWVNKDKKSLNVKLYGDPSDRKFHIRRRKQGANGDDQNKTPILAGASLKSRLDVNTTKNKKVMRIGLASVNMDFSISGFYDILPKTMDFQVRIPKEKEEEIPF